jgi:hypothetical protein
MWKVTGLLLVGLCGCTGNGTPPLLEQSPAADMTLRGNYKSIASCSYSRLTAAAGGGIKKIDLENSTILAMEPTGIKYWELTFKPESANTTKIIFTNIQTAVGPMKFPDVLPEVQRCAQS